MKLASVVVLLAVCRTLQTDPEWLVQPPRYAWRNMSFYAYLPNAIVRGTIFEHLYLQN